MDNKNCSFGEGITVTPDGKNELDPCIYEELARYANVTVIISKCKKCGKIDISWEKQDDTEEISFF